MKGSLLVVVVVAILLIVGGLLVYRSTAPNGDVVPEGEATLEEDSGLAPENQFLQLLPEESPPGEDVDEAAGVPTPPGAADEDEEASESATSGGETETVSMTDTGFVPSVVQIGVGDTVNFVNNGQALHWPASDEHPTHQELPGFDSLQGVATGASYSYTFEEAGSWGFHDHLNPELTGTVVVE